MLYGKKSDKWIPQLNISKLSEKAQDWDDTIKKNPRLKSDRMIGNSN